MIVERVVVGDLDTNCYVVGCERTRLGTIIDPGGDASTILAALRRHDLTLDRLIATHAHFDHILAVRELQERTGAKFYLHAADSPLLKNMQRTAIAWTGRDPGEPPGAQGYLVPGETIRLGDVALEIRGTPGHSPGGISLVEHGSRRVFTGDALFAGSIGRTDLPGGKIEVLLESIQREILSLPDDYALLPGHGPSSTIWEERRSNPFLAMQSRSGYLG